MGGDTILVRRGQTGLQVGNNRTVMFYFDYQRQSPAASRLPLLLLLLLLRTAANVLLPPTPMSDHSNEAHKKWL